MLLMNTVGKQTSGWVKGFGGNDVLRRNFGGARALKRDFVISREPKTEP